MSVEVDSIAYFDVGSFGLTVGDFDGRKRPYLQKKYTRINKNTTISR